MNPVRFLLLAAPAALLLAGCASKKVLFFGTDTSLGLNVSGTTQVPNKIAFAYERSEIAFVPRNPGGPAHSVVGALDADITFWGDKAIHQVFAIGQAAENYADRVAGNALQPAAADPAPAAGDANSNESLVFLTHTTTGLKFAAGEGAVAPNFLLGFRRGEAALVPVKNNEKARSVFGELSYSTSEAASVPAAPAVAVPGSSLKGVRIKQVFATGRAAEVYAGSTEGVAKISAALDGNVPTADTSVLTFMRPVTAAYTSAQAAGDTEAIKAFDAAAKAVGPEFTTAVQFFTKVDKTLAQARSFDAAARADARSGQYYR